MAETTLLLAYSLYPGKKSRTRVNALLDVLANHEAGSGHSFAIRTSASFLEDLDQDLMHRMTAFIESRRLGIVIDSLDYSFHGILSERDLTKDISESIKLARRQFPTLEPLLMPHWHDAQRPSAARAYANCPSPVLIPGASPLNPCMFIADAEIEQFIPSLYINPSTINVRRSEAKILAAIRRITQHYNEALEARQLKPSPSLPVLILIDEGSDEYFEQVLQVPGMLAARGMKFEVPGGGITGLRFGEKTGQNEESLVSLPAPHFGLPRFDVPKMTPSFIGQLMPASFSKRLRKAEISTSVFSEHASPDQRVEEKRPQREVTSSMLGQAYLKEGELNVWFTGGNITRLQDGAGDLSFSGGLSSRIILSRAGKTRKTSYEVESAFALETAIGRGLRQTLKLAVPESQISGRITNDYLQLEDMTEIILDSYIQHPWIREEYEIDSYIPQMIELWADLPAQELVDLRSRNSDGSGRNFRFRPADIIGDGDEVLLLLPGCNWILNRGPQGLGIELIHGNRQKIDLPSAVKISKLKRDRFSLSFLPTAEYVHPAREEINGILEHYSLRFKPNLRRSEDLTEISRKVQNHIAPPFCIFY